MEPTRMVIRLSLTLAGVLVLGAALPSWAGDCVGQRREFVASLERGPADRDFDWMLRCLNRHCWLDTRLWAGPQAASAFARARADTLAPRIGAAAARLLGDPWAQDPDHRRELLAVAAGQGIAWLDSVDVFAELFPAASLRTDYVLMAILRDCRGVEVLRSRYTALRTDPSKAGAEEAVDVLSCLYHLPCDEATKLAADLLAVETDEYLRGRLQRVLDRGR
ncbi:MAG: hypothetical protein IPO18_12130 [bacterium]|nr:hypothetical protein [bacterium]MBK9473012.1 hypothetical protein [bacterium]